MCGGRDLRSAILPRTVILAGVSGLHDRVPSVATALLSTLNAVLSKIAMVLGVLFGVW